MPEERVTTNALGTFRFVRHEANVPFTCDRCAALRPYKKEKKAKNIAYFTPADGGAEQKLCNGCYGELLASVGK